MRGLSPPGALRVLRRNPWPLAVAGVVLLAFGLRVWGIGYGLPFAYNTDEERLYVRKAVQMIDDGDFHTNYFQNPPAYTYIVRLALTAPLAGEDASAALGNTTRRDDLYVIARVITALLGTLGVWLLFIAGRRLFDHWAGFLAAVIGAVAFLSVFYSHLALSNVPAMTAACLALVGIAGVLRRGVKRDYVIAGLGVGLAAVTKYIDGIVLLPLLAAAYLAPREQGSYDWRRGLMLALGLSAFTFVVINPYAVIDPLRFWHGLTSQSDLAAQEKIGLGKDGPVAYYLWTFTWGLGWVPSIAAIIGAGLLAFRDRRAAWVLIPIVPVFFLYMSGFDRYFGRWALPLFPGVMLLAGYAGSQAIAKARELAAKPGSRVTIKRALAPLTAGLVLVALGAQGLVFSVHNDRVLSRPHTQNLARNWMLANIPARAGVITEPFRTNVWRRPWPNSEQSLRNPVGYYGPYARYLSPAAITAYERNRYCWVVSTSQYWGLTLSDPDNAPLAPAYWRDLAKRSDTVYSVSPWGDRHSGGGPGQDEVDFNFDWTYDFYPLSYERPGPFVRIYRLTGGRCAGNGALQPPIQTPVTVG